MSLRVVKKILFSFPDNKSLSSQKLGQILPKLEFASARTGPTGLADRADRLNLYDLVGPTIIKTRSSIYLSLTHSSLSLSPSPSISLPHSPSRALSPTQTLDFKSLIPNRSQGHGSFKSAWRTIFPTYSSPESLGFQVLRGEKAHPRYIKFVSAWSLFLGWLEWFPWVNHLHRSYWTRA